MKRATALSLVTALVIVSCTTPRTPVSKAPPAAPEASASNGTILLLGDSQISFGAGSAYQKFFTSLASNCPQVPATLATARAASIGVRSSALHNWTATRGAARGVICDVDKAHGVNAGAYGVTSAGRTYVQIGQNPDYPFCTAGQSPLEAVFAAPAYDPDLLVLAVLGNAAARWQSPATARRDWKETARQLPPQVPCIVMTTIPAFASDDNQRRLRAQSNLARAVQADGRCAFVEGLTTATLAEFENNPTHFRTDADGAVTDPRHPTAASAARFTALQTPALCAAIARVMQN